MLRIRLVPVLASEDFRRLARAHFGASAWLLVGTVVSGILSYGAVALSARLLGTDGFGLLGALLGVSSLATVLLRPASYAATHLAIAESSRGGGLTALRGLFGLSLAVSITLAACLVSVLLLFATPLNGVLRTSGLLPLGLLVPLLAGSASLQLTSGLLSGANQFAWLAGAGVVESVARLMVTVPLVFMWGVSGSITAYVVGQIAGFVFSIARAGLAWRSPPIEELRASLRTGVSAISLVLGVALLQNGDLVLLRWYGHPEGTGLYAACASLGNLFVTLSAPLYLPAFPRALAAYRQGKATFAFLVAGIGPILAAGAMATVGSLWLGHPVVGLLFGSAYESAGDILPVYLAKTIALVLAGVIGQHAMATSRGASLHIAVPVAIAGLAALVFFQPDPRGTALVVLLSAAVLTAWLAARTVSLAKS